MKIQNEGDGGDYCVEKRWRRDRIGSVKTEIQGGCRKGKWMFKLENKKRLLSPPATVWEPQEDADFCGEGGGRTGA
jgi:hypothetical protein